MPITDQELADEIIARLNRLIESDPGVRADIGRLIEQRVACSEATMSHPTIQAQPFLPGMGIRVKPGAVGPAGQVGFLGVLNGLVGIIPEGGRPAGYGYIAAVIDDHGNLERFRRTDVP